MTETQVLTAVASGLFGLLVFHFRRYYYWWKWSRAVVPLGAIVLFAINGALGLAFYALAHAVDWKAPGGALLAAAQYAFAGEALVRTQIRGYDLDRAEGALTLLTLLAQFVVDGLDALAGHKVGTWVRAMSDDAIRTKSLELLTNEVAEDSKLNDPVKEKLITEIKAASQSMRTEDPVEGRGILNGFCIRQISTRHLTP